MLYLEFISMARILLELEPWNMLFFQKQGNLVLKKRKSAIGNWSKYVIFSTFKNGAQLHFKL